jgi:hypothetical protein
MADDLKAYLDTTKLSNDQKYDAYEAYNKAQDHDTFRANFDNLSVPVNVKKDLYDLKFGTDHPAPRAQSAAAPAPQSKVNSAWEYAKGLFKGMSPLDMLLGGGNAPAVPMSDEDKAQQAQVLQANTQNPADKGGDLARQTIANQQLMKTSVIPQAVLNPARGMVNSIQNPIVRGSLKGLGKTAEALTTPESVGTIAATMLPGVGEGALAGFGLDQAKGVLQGGARAVQDIREGNTAAAAEDTTSTVANAGMLGLLARGHGETPEAPAAPAPAPTEAPFQPTAPITGEQQQLGTFNENGTPVPMAMQGTMVPEHTAPTAPQEPIQRDYSNQYELPHQQAGLFDANGQPSVETPMRGTLPPARSIEDRVQAAQPNSLTDLNGVQQAFPYAQGEMFGNEPTAPTAQDISTGRLNAQTDLNPMQGRMFDQAGEPTPAPEAPGTDRVASTPIITKAPDVFNQLGSGTPSPEPTAPHAETPVLPEPKAEANPAASVKAPEEAPLPLQPEAPAAKEPSTPEGTQAQGGPDPARVVADKSRRLIGNILNLSRLVKGNRIHTTLDKAILETNQLLQQHEITDPDHPNYDPAGPTVGAGLNPEEQALLSHLFGERVGSVLTEDQLARAYEFKGRRMGDTPVLQLRNLAGKDKVDAARQEIAKAAAATSDPAERAKLLSALEPDENGNNRPFLYEPVRENIPNQPVDPNHPEAPFGTVAFGATAPKITVANLRDSLNGSTVRNLHLDMGDPGIARQLRPDVATPSTEGEQEVMNGLDSFGLDRRAHDPNITGDAAQLESEYHESGLRNKINQLASKLRETIGGFRQTTNGTDKLVEQLKALPPETLNLLPKEVHDLVKPPTTETPESMGSSAASKGQEAPAEATKTGTPEATKVTPSAKTIQTAMDGFAKAFPEKLEKAQKLGRTAMAHFGTDLKGAKKAALDAINMYRAGLEAGDPWAYRKAALEIKGRTPAEPGEGGTTLNSGLNPAPLVKGVKQVINRSRAKLDAEDETISTEDAMNSILTRFEQMDPTNRSAYSRSIHDDMLDRMASEGDLDGKLGFKDRLTTIRESVPRNTINATFKHWLLNKITGTVTPEEQQGTDAMNNIRFKNAERANNIAAVRSQLESANSVVERWSSFDRRDFTNKMERGVDQGDPFKNQLAGMLREALDQARNRITAVNGNFAHYLENYFPHMYDNVGKVREMVQQTRGLTGDQSFLKSRELDLINDAYRAGFKEKTDNPIRSVLARVEQMERYSMKEYLKKQAIDSGVAKLIDHNESVPAGYATVNDPAFQSGTARWFLPKEMAKKFNTFTSEGYAGSRLAGLPIYDAFKSVTNVQNSAQLSWSALHGFFGGVNSYLTEQARGSARMANAVLRGDFKSGDFTKGLQILANSPRIWRTVSMGTDLIAHIKNPTQFQDYASLQHDMLSGGNALARYFKDSGVSLQDLGTSFNRGGMHVKDNYYGESWADKFNDSMARAKDDALSGPQRGKAFIGATLNKTMQIASWPTRQIMDELIPALKAGHFALQAGDILGSADGKSFNEVTNAMGKVADNMDDRFGQVVYDNMFFMNKAAKDIMQVIMRSPGWNIGTARAIGGGIADAVAAARDAVTKKQKFQISDRTAYLGAMVANTMLANAVGTMLMSGSMPHGADYFFARTGTLDANGQPNRIMPKMYFYDAVNFAKHPGTSTLHKMNPTLGTLSDLWTNKTFYGSEIYDPGSTLGARLGQMANFTASEEMPFSYSNYKEAQARGESTFMSVVGSMTGVNPAPKDIGRTDAENLANRYFADSQRSGGTPTDDFDRRQDYQAAVAKFRNGSMSKEEVMQKIKTGKLPFSILNHIYDHGTPMVVRWTKAEGVSPEQAMHVFLAGNAAERKELVPVLLKKVSRITDLEGRQNYIDSIRRGIGQGPATTPASTPDYHPTTHVFSPTKYAADNPYGDVAAATDEAKKQGFVIHAH